MVAFSEAIIAIIIKLLRTPQMIDHGPDIKQRQHSRLCPLVKMITGSPVFILQKRSKVDLKCK